jgi:hypothetical protein
MNGGGAAAQDCYGISDEERKLLDPEFILGMFSEKTF